MSPNSTPNFQKPDLYPVPNPPDFHQETTASPTHDGLHFWQFMVAGSIAGSVEHMAMFPVDTIKTRMQALGGSCPIKSAGLRQALGSTFRSEGLFGLYRGIGAMGLGAGPAHAVYFSVYEFCKKAFSGDNPNNAAAHAAAGVVATVASDAVLTPMDVVKQRLQLGRGYCKGVLDCVVRVLREEGIMRFYASYWTTVVINVPFTAVHFATYEAAKRGLMEVSPESANDERWVVHATAGAVAGAVAAFVTTPLDVVKTQLQCQIFALSIADLHSKSNLRSTASIHSKSLFVKFVADLMTNLTKEEFVHILRRQSIGFSRGSSKYRGVTLHKCGLWGAQVGQFLGKKYMYLGLFNGEVEVARSLCSLLQHHQDSLF